MSWRKYLLLPRLARAGLGPARPPGVAWDSYWQGVHRTGPEGDVLWDGAGEQEMRWWLDRAGEHLDPRLPLLDVGCGNGRLSRLLAGGFPRVVGIDVSEAAVALARQESEQSKDGGRVSFRALDVTSDGAGVALASELRPANVVVRGVFHVLDPEQRAHAAANLAQVLGDGGRLLLLETNYPGGLLEYLEYLGGQRGRLPAPLARLIDYRTPRPSAFGPEQLAETFPAPGWATVVSGATQIAPVRTLGSAAGRTIPGFFAVLRAGRGTAEPNGRQRQMSQKRSEAPS